MGTRRIGSDSDSVVDAQLRVRGIANLRVADASVRRGHTTLYAEDASRIRDELRRRPDANLW